MEKKREIAMVLRQVTFAEAESDDDFYWVNTSDAERLNMLFEIRKMMPGTNRKIKKVISKRKWNEED